MAAETPRRDPNRAPVHPGEILREDVLPSFGMAVSTALEHLGVTRQTLRRIGWCRRHHARAGASHRQILR